MQFRSCGSSLLLACLLATQAATAAVTLAPARSERGYVARLLINEVPFPGERGWESEADSKDAMRQILLVLDARLNRIPPGYTRMEIAAVESDNVIAVITAGGVHGQVEGFYLDPSGQPATVARVQSRLDYLTNIASQGTPGAFARLLNHAQALADAYFQQSPPKPDVFAGVTKIYQTSVTGRAYSWMTDIGQFHPGGRYIRIPDSYQGSLGGNRFFTLKDLTK